MIKGHVLPVVDDGDSKAASPVPCFSLTLGVLRTRLRLFWTTYMSRRRRQRRRRRRGLLRCPILDCMHGIFSQSYIIGAANQGGHCSCTLRRAFSFLNHQVAASPPPMLFLHLLLRIHAVFILFSFCSSYTHLGPFAWLPLWICWMVGSYVQCHCFQINIIYCYFPSHHSRVNLRRVQVRETHLWVIFWEIDRRLVVCLRWAELFMSHRE